MVPAASEVEIERVDQFNLDLTDEIVQRVLSVQRQLIAVAGVTLGVDDEACLMSTEIAH